MKLAFFIPSMRGGGAERVTATLAREFAGRGFDVDLVLAKAEGPYLSEITPSVRVIDLNASRVLFAGAGLVRYLRRNRPDGMVAAMAHANILALYARRMAGVPTRLVVCPHTTLSEAAKNPKNNRARFVPFAMRRCFSWADEIVAVSHGSADDLAHVARLPRERIRVIYNPVDQSKLIQMANVALDDPWFDSGQPPVLLSVGRLIKSKDFATLIRAFAQIRRKRPARLVILGEGPERSQLEILIRSLRIESDVRLPGFVSNPYAYMSRASLLAMTSHYEGLPVVLIEAMCCGLPVISTDCPHGPAEILDGGRYGQLVRIGDVNGLVHGIEQSLNSPTSRPEAESLRRFELGTVANQYLSLLSRN